MHRYLLRLIRMAGVVGLAINWASVSQAALRFGKQLSRISHFITPSSLRNLTVTPAERVWGDMQGFAGATIGGENWSPITVSIFSLSWKLKLMNSELNLFRIPGALKRNVLHKARFNLIGLLLWVLRNSKNAWPSTPNTPDNTDTPIPPDFAFSHRRLFQWLDDTLFHQQARLGCILEGFLGWPLRPNRKTKWPLILLFRLERMRKLCRHVLLVLKAGKNRFSIFLKEDEEESRTTNLLNPFLVDNDSG